MLGIRVKETDRYVVIKWQLSKLEIPKEEIIKVSMDDTYGGKGVTPIRIGLPYGTTERVVIETKNQNYLLYTNKSSLKGKIESMLL